MKRIGLFIAILTFGLSALTQTVNAQDKKAKTEKATKPASSTQKKPSGFKKLAGGLEYKNIKYGTGTRKPQLKDHIEMNIHIHIGDSSVFDSRKMYNNKPVPFTIAPPKQRGDLTEGFMEMVAGDSAVFLFSVDTMKATGAQMPPWVQPGQKIEYNVSMVSVMSEEQYKKDADEKAARQMAIDEVLLKDYFKKHNLNPTKTASGLYYTIVKDGEGPTAKKGELVTANYTGKILDGNTFDSNTDSAFKHVQPYPFTVGKGIRGWDEGLQFLKKGSKAIFYIPSTLAYGAQDQKGIPANSILVFDVEALNIESPVDQAAKDDKILQDYFAAHNIVATKTTSGLYYVMSQKGLGPMAKTGKKVTVNYTGKTLDGNVFDSNTDPSKGHVQPFSFNLGVGQVIKGWDEGIQLLNMGAKCTLYIPSGLAYGPSGNPPAIPQNACLVFDVEMLSIDKQ